MKFYRNLVNLYTYIETESRNYHCSQSHSCAQMANGNCFCFVLFFFEIKLLKDGRLWVSRPNFQNQCPKSLIPGVRQVAVFPIGPKMKVTKSKSN